MNKFNNYDEIIYLSANGFIDELAKKINKETMNGYETKYGNFTPLSASILSYDIKIVKFLLDYGVDINKKFFVSDYGGINTYSIHLSIIQESYLFYNGFYKELDISITKLLVEYEANFNLLDSNNNTALDTSINFNNNIAETYLRNLGAKKS